MRLHLPLSLLFRDGGFFLCSLNRIQQLTQIIIKMLTGIQLEQTDPGGIQGNVFFFFNSKNIILLNSTFFGHSL